MCYNRDLDSLEYLLNRLFRIWTIDDIERLVIFLLKESWQDGISSFIKSKALQSIVFAEEERYRQELFHKVINDGLKRYKDSECA